MSSPERLREDFSNSSVENTTAAPDWTQAYEAVRWIQLTMALLSVLGSGSILVSVMLQRLSRRTEVTITLKIVSDLLLALCWIIGASLYSRNHSAHTLCYQLHTVEQVLYMASFFYTLNFVFNLYRGIREQHYSCRDGYVQFSNRVSAAGKITAVLSGVSPVLLMTPVFIQGSLSQCETNFSEPYRCLLMHTGALFLTSEQQPIRACRLLHTYRSVLFLASFLLTLLSIIVLVRKSRRLYRRVVTSAGYLGNQQRACVHLMERRMLLFPLVFLLCWGPAGQGVVGVVLYVSE
ncbi:Transmembrane protein 116, partial [Dissostichus eleginoides]